MRWRPWRSGASTEVAHREVSPDSPEWPVGLEKLEEPPTIFVDGTLSEAPGIAVVGSRQATRYGIDLAESYGAALARVGWTVVSGLARGIDAAAHRGCLRSGGHAVAVLGCGIDVCYPRENRGLFDQIRESGGAIISEYKAGAPPERWRFPARNRIIAAISVAVVVVESARRGGALITARLGGEMGRELFAVPGDVGRPASEGCNLLIRDGAAMVLGPADLIEAISITGVGPPPGRAGAPPPGDEASLGSPVPAGGMSLDELPEAWSVTMSEALVRVGKLEIEGSIRRDGDRILPLRR